MVYDGKPDEVGLVAVTVQDQDAVPEVEGHIFVRSKPSWHTIGDHAPQEMGVPEEMKEYTLA
jgi:hypothetical protein